MPDSWTPAGDTLAFTVEKGGATSLWTVAISGGAAPKPLVVTAQDSQTTAAFSPDGRWIAYGANAVSLGRQTYYVFVRPLPITEAKYQVTTTAASTPVWSHDGKRLYYSFANTVSSSDVHTGSGFAFDQPTPISIEGMFSNNAGAAF